MAAPFSLGFSLPEIRKALMTLNGVWSVSFFLCRRKAPVVKDEIMSGSSDHKTPDFRNDMQIRRRSSESPRHFSPGHIKIKGTFSKKGK